MLSVLYVGSDMRRTLRCIQSNVRNKCGEEASELAATLVKPMVRQSTKCDYSIVTQAVSVAPVSGWGSQTNMPRRKGTREIDEVYCQHSCLIKCSSIFQHGENFTNIEICEQSNRKEASRILWKITIIRKNLSKKLKTLYASLTL